MELTNITVNDPLGSYLDIMLWAKSHCPSYQRSLFTDVSYLSTNIHLIYEVWFEEVGDALVFALKWS